MSGTKISALTTTTTMASADLIPIVQSGVNKAITFANFTGTAVGDLNMASHAIRRVTTITDASNATSADIANRILDDSSAVTSVDWQNRTLDDSSGIISANWQNRILYAADGTTPGVEWGSIGTVTIFNDLSVGANVVMSGTCRISGDQIIDSGSNTVLSFDGSGNVTIFGNFQVNSNTTMSGLFVQGILKVNSTIQDASGSSAITFDGAANTTVVGNLTANTCVNFDQALGSTDVPGTSIFMGGDDFPHWSDVSKVDYTFVLSKTLSINSDTSLKASTTYLVDTSATRNLTLPTPVNGIQITIKDATFQSATNYINLQQNGGEAIENVNSSMHLQTNGGYWTFVSDGTNWFLIG